MFGNRFLAGIFLLLLCVPAAHADDDDPDAGAVQKRHYVSLRSGEVNMRVGPGTRYSINWVYKREGLPVLILQEFDQWREIQDADGTHGWVHKQMLQGKRMGLVVDGIGVLRRTPEEHGGPVLRVEAGVTGRLLECERDWCRMQISGRKGWVEKSHLWGVYSKEEF